MFSQGTQVPEHKSDATTTSRQSTEAPITTPAQEMPAEASQLNHRRVFRHTVDRVYELIRSSSQRSEMMRYGLNRLMTRFNVDPERINNVGGGWIERLDCTVDSTLARLESCIESRPDSILNAFAALSLNNVSTPESELREAQALEAAGIPVDEENVSTFRGFWFTLKDKFAKSKWFSKVDEILSQNAVIMTLTGKLSSAVRPAEIFYNTVTEEFCKGNVRQVYLNNVMSRMGPAWDERLASLARAYYATASAVAKVVGATGFFGGAMALCRSRVHTLMDEILAAWDYLLDRDRDMEFNPNYSSSQTDSNLTADGGLVYTRAKGFFSLTTKDYANTNGVDVAAEPVKEGEPASIIAREGQPNANIASANETHDERGNADSEAQDVPDSNRLVVQTNGSNSGKSFMRQSASASTWSTVVTDESDDSPDQCPQSLSSEKMDGFGGNVPIRRRSLGCIDDNDSNMSSDCKASSSATLETLCFILKEHTQPVWFSEVDAILMENKLLKEIGRIRRPADHFFVTCIESACYQSLNPNEFDALLKVRLGDSWDTRLTPYARSLYNMYSSLQKSGGV